MVVRIEVSDEWTSTTGEDGVVHRLGDTTVHALPIRELPLDSARWMHQVAVAGAPAGTRATELGRHELVTVDGWRALLLEMALEHAELRRVRVVALYKFLDYAAGAIIDIAASWYAAQREDLIALLRGARPDWGPQDRTCLATMFQGAHQRLLTLK